MKSRSARKQPQKPKLKQKLERTKQQRPSTLASPRNPTLPIRASLSSGPCSAANIFSVDRATTRIYHITRTCHMTSTAMARTAIANNPSVPNLAHTSTSSARTRYYVSFNRDIMPQVTTRHYRRWRRSLSGIG